MIRFLVLFLSFSVYANEKSVPVYLGPGSDKLSPDEYQRVYKNYIQTSILLGYPLFKGGQSACDQALDGLFRQNGMYTYPVPADADQVVRTSKVAGNSYFETYELAGTIIQVNRIAGTKALDYVIILNSSSTKAVRRLAKSAKAEPLTLAKDPITNLEKVKGIPVGFPHPLLGPSGQGLQVKILKFNQKNEGCEPIDFSDNSWVAGFELNESKCSALQGEVNKVWSEKESPADFAQNQLKQMKDLALKSAVSNGVKPEAAKQMVAKHFVPPFTNDINIIGTAMRNLAQCNFLALGVNGKKTPADEPTPSNKNSNSGISGTAK